MQFINGEPAEKVTLVGNGEASKLLKEKGIIFKQVSDEHRIIIEKAKDLALARAFFVASGLSKDDVDIAIPYLKVERPGGMARDIFEGLEQIKAVTVGT